MDKFTASPLSALRPLLLPSQATACLAPPIILPPRSHLTLVSQPVGLPSISILIEASELAAFWRQRGAIHHGRRGHVTWDLGPRDA